MLTIPTIQERYLFVSTTYPFSDFKYLTNKDYELTINKVIMNLTIKNGRHYYGVVKYILLNTCNIELTKLNRKNKFIYLHALSVLSLFSRKWVKHHYKFRGRGYQRLLSGYE